MKKVIITIMMLTLVFAMVLAGNVNAAATVTTALSATTIEQGETLIVTVKPNETLKGISFRVNYDEKVLEFVGYEGPDVTIKDAAVSAPGLVSAMFATSKEATDMAVKLKFKAITTTEKTEISVVDLALKNGNDEESTPSVAANTLVVKEKAVVDPDPIDPVDPDPTDPVDPDPTDPVDPNPTDPVDPDPTDPVDPKPTDPVNPSDPGEVTEKDPKPSIPQTGANIFAYALSGIALVTVIALVVKTKKD